MRSVGPAHHEAFAEADGEDPDWPIWYAEFLREEASAALNADLSRDELAVLLGEAEKARGGRTDDWTEFYVDYLIDAQ